MKTYETFPVEQGKGFLHGEQRGEDDIAEDIRSIYQKVAEGCGSIIAGHTVEVNAEGRTPTSFLFLVAEYTKIEE